MAPRKVDRYEYGFQLWRRWLNGKLFKEDSMILDARYFMLVMEGESELVDHGCGPDCECWKKEKM